MSPTLHVCVCACTYTYAEPARMSEVQQNGLPTEEEAIGEVSAPQVTPLAPPTSSGSAAQPEMPSGHIQGETDAPTTEPEAYTAMETQEPEAAKGNIPYGMKYWRELYLADALFLGVFQVRRILLWRSLSRADADKRVRRYASIRAEAVSLVYCMSPRYLP